MKHAYLYTLHCCKKKTSPICSNCARFRERSCQPYQATLYHTIPYHTLPTIPGHTVPYYIVSYCTLPTIPYHHITGSLSGTRGISITFSGCRRSDHRNWLRPSPCAIFILRIHENSVSFTKTPSQSTW